MTDPNFVLRAGQAGPIVKGTPGNVLTFGANGERIGGAPGGGGACVSNAPIITGLYACAENDGCEASGDASHATGYQTRAAGFASTAMGANTQAVGGYSTAMGINTAAGIGADVACGNESEARQQADFVHAAGGFGSVRGTAQWRFNEYRGQTFGNAGGESVELKIGNNPNPVDSGRCYYVIVTCIGVLMGVGAGTKQSGSFERRFLMNVDSGGTASFSAVTDGPDIVVGATFVGATIIPAPGDFSNEWKLTFSLNEAVTAAVNVCAHVEFLEVQGD